MGLSIYSNWGRIKQVGFEGIPLTPVRDEYQKKALEVQKAYVQLEAKNQLLLAENKRLSANVKSEAEERIAEIQKQFLVTHKTGAKCNLLKGDSITILRTNPIRE